MKRNRIVDLTSLLDIILILLFAFMINMADSVNEQEKSTEAAQKTIENLTSELKEQKTVNQVQIEALQNMSPQEARSIMTLLTTLSTKGVDPEVVNATLQKYAAISKYYVFLDVELQTSDSHILINGEATDTFILAQELVDPITKGNKQSSVEDLIANYLDNLEGGYSFALITLAEDGQVKRAQYNLVWEAIKAIQLKKDSEKVFITQIQALKP